MNNIKDTITRSINLVRKAVADNDCLKGLKIRRIGNPRSQVFFGYYDVTPFSNDNKLLLAMHAPIENITPKPDSKVKVGYYDLSRKDSSFIETGSTTTWCWQQGCRLQWYPLDNGSNILYNRLVNGQYGCVIQDIGLKEITKEYDTPIYAVSRDGRWGLSLNFSRLQRLRPGYGYVNLPDETKDQLAPEDDGIWRIDMETGAKILLFSVADITKFEPLESMDGAEHYFNHILFNPDVTRFMFIHLWIKDRKRYGRLITCNIDGNEKFALINEGHTSHYTWKSNDELLVYAFHADSGMNYNLYRDRSDHRKTVGSELLTGDGHPSFSPEGSYLITDTYPDRLRNQRLLIYTLQNNSLTCINSFFSPRMFTGETRCDLHPRLSPDGNYVCVDSIHGNKRAMYVIDMGQCFNSAKGT